jgi:phage baseplate assembly protein W
MAIKTQAYGITLPIMRGPQGYFAQSYDVIEQIKSNINLLLRTKKGERRMNPEFGSSLWSLLFQNYGDDFTPVIETAVKSDISRWMPYVNVEYVKTVVEDDKNKNYHVIHVSVLFTVPTIGATTTQTLDLVLNSNNI